MIRVFNGRSRGLAEGQERRGYAQIAFEFRDHIKVFRGLGDSAFAVFMCLMLHSDENGWSRASQGRISAETGWSVTAVSDATRKLSGATINGCRLLLAYQPVSADGHFQPYRYLVFPSTAEVAQYETMPLSQRNKQALGKASSPPPLQPGAVQPPAVQRPAVEGGAKNNHIQADLFHDDDDAPRGGPPVDNFVDSEKIERAIQIVARLNPAGVEGTNRQRLAALWCEFEDGLEIISRTCETTATEAVAGDDGRGAKIRNMSGLTVKRLREAWEVRTGQHKAAWDVADQRLIVLAKPISEHAIARREFARHANTNQEER